MRMRDKIRKVMLWIGLGITAVAAFLLALNITTNTLEADTSISNVVIDLNKDPYDAEENSHKETTKKIFFINYSREKDKK